LRNVGRGESVLCRIDLAASNSWLASTSKAVSRCEPLDAECRHPNLQTPMKKNLLISRIAIVALGAGTLCLATTSSALTQYPPLRTGANKDVAQPTPSPAKGAAKAASKLSAADKAFMMNAAKGGMMEVEWGKLAAQNGQNADVKKFGNRMVTDHSKANSELMGLAKEEGVSLPAAKSAGKWKSDKDYMDMMVKDHQADLAEFQKEAQSGTDPDLKAYAAKGAKMVSTHLKLAQETQGKLK
jgi:putative membrane protein